MAEEARVAEARPSLSPWVHPEPLHASVVQECEKQPRVQPGQATVSEQVLVHEGASVGPQRWSPHPLLLLHQERGWFSRWPHIYAHIFFSQLTDDFKSRRAMSRKCWRAPWHGGGRACRGPGWGACLHPSWSLCQDILGIWRQIPGETSWGHRGPRPA